MSIWVIDAGPLIFLAKLGRLELLRTVCDEVYVPAEVISEIHTKSDEASSAIKEATKTWLQVHEVKNRDAVNLLLADLDLGEAEAITLASENNADKIVIDDLDARRFVRRVGISAVGTIGILLAARLKGEIPSLKDEIEQLQEHGFWISEALAEKALIEAGEI